MRLPVFRVEFPAHSGGRFGVRCFSHSRRRNDKQPQLVSTRNRHFCPGFVAQPGNRAALRPAIVGAIDARRGRLGSAPMFRDALCAGSASGHRA